MTEQADSISTDVQAMIDERVGDLAERETLSKTRVEAVRLTLEDLARRGEWPAPEDADETELEIAIESATRAAQKVDRLERELASTKKGAALGDRAMLGKITREVRASVLSLVKGRIPEFKGMSAESKGAFDNDLKDAIRAAVASALKVKEPPPGAVG